MKKLIAILFLISIVFVIGCVQQPQLKTISELDESGENVILEGTISYEHLGQTPFEGCYLNDGTGAIKLLGKIAVMEIYPPKCQYEGKKVRITGTYINKCVRFDDNGFEVAIAGCYPYIDVSSIEVIGDGDGGEGTALSFQEVAMPGPGGYMEADEFVIDNSDDWANTYFGVIGVECAPGTACLPPLPYIDFAEETAIIVTMGMKNTGGYSIIVTGVTEYEDEVVVKVRRTSPGAGCSVTMAITYPYHIIKVDSKITKAVRFEYENAVTKCEAPHAYPMDFELIESGGYALDFTGETGDMQLEPAELVINDQEEWERVYVRTLGIVSAECIPGEPCLPLSPEVDFETETVIAVYRGAGGMCSLETEFPDCFGIREIVNARTEYVVTVREYLPDEGCAVPTGIGSPYVFIKVDGVIKDTRTKPVLFEYQDVMVDCEEDFCGWSTYANCSTDSDCITGGCSGQVCQHKDEEGLGTTCEWLDCYDDVAYDMACKCINSQCQWGSLLDMI